MKQINSLFFILFTFIITGCTITPDNDNVVIKNKINYLSIPESYLINCDFPKPPEITQYLNMSTVEKETTLSNLYIKASKLNNDCNARLKAARDYQSKQLKIYKGDDSDPSSISKESIKKNP